MCDQRIAFVVVMQANHWRCELLQGDIKAKDSISSDDGTCAAVRWLSKKQLEQEGLSSGVKKVYALLYKSRQCEQRGIKRFFRSS